MIQTGGGLIDDIDSKVEGQPRTSFSSYKNEKWFLGTTVSGQRHAFRVDPKMLSGYRSTYPTIEGPMLKRRAQAKQTKIYLTVFKPLKEA